MWDLIVSVPDHCLSFYSRMSELQMTDGKWFPVVSITNESHHKTFLLLF